MKVRMKDDYRSVFTLRQVDIARAIIRDLKSDTSTPSNYAQSAVVDFFENNKYGDYFREVLVASATVSRNHRAWDVYFEGSEDMDVWIDATVRTGNGFLIIGAYLSDIWMISPDESRAYTYYTRYFEEV